MADRHIDARNLTCPLPVLKLRKALGDMEVGQTVEMRATDPGALDDVPHFCASAGCELLEIATDDANIHRFVIRKGDHRPATKRDYNETGEILCGSTLFRKKSLYIGAG